MSKEAIDNDWLNFVHDRGLYLACWGHPRHEYIWSDAIGADGG